LTIRVENTSIAATVGEPVMGHRIIVKLDADAMVGANSNLALDIAISRAAFSDLSSRFALATR